MYSESESVIGLSRFYNLDQLASIDNTHFFTSMHDNVIMNRNVLTNYFDIEEDITVSINNLPWHLGRVAKEKLPLSETFPYTGKGSCHRNTDFVIDSYVVDTGIDISHSQFEGRAKWGANFVDDKDTDCNMHGTHVSGLIGSKDYGVCVDANLYAVKVLGCQGEGSLSGVIKGIEWVFDRHLEKSKTAKVKSIINMSLGGGFSKALNKATESCLANNADFYIVAAAGNENSDACNTSPASSPSVLTVMASDSNDKRAWFSNFGKCTDIYSPGVDILSTIPNEQTAVLSGTSMATPVLVGVLNHYIDIYPNLNMKDIKEKMIQDATASVESKKHGTSNKLVFLVRN